MQCAPQTGHGACPVSSAPSCQCSAASRSHGLCKVRLHRLDQSCPFECDRSPSELAISRADPSSGRRVHLILRDACGCDDGSATRRTCLHDLAGRLRSEGKKCPAHPRSGRIESAHRATPESATLRSLSEHLTLVTAVTAVSCDMAEVPPTRLLFVFESECGIYLFILLLIYFTAPT